jgi:hypothetical protein
MLPGVGDLVAAEDLRTAAQDNDWAGIGMGLLAAIPGIPALGGAARGAKRQARRGLLEPAARPAPRSGLLAGGTEADEALARYRAVNPQDTGARVLNPGDEGYPTNAQWDEASQAYVAPVEPDYPIRAFHGSPHSFDRFSLDKIGTGEGAQAYGHGLYFAESEDVARAYRDQLSRHSIAAPDGRVVPNRTLGDDEAALEALDDIASASGVPELSSRASRYSHSYGDIMDTALQRSDWDGLPATIRSLRDAEIDNLERTWASPDQIEAAREAYENAAQAAEYANRNSLGRHPGSMYEVGINAHPDTFLDWDRPLSEQPEVLQRLGFANMDEDAIHAEAARIFEAQPGGAWMEDPVSKARIDELNTMLERRPPSGTGQDFYRGGANNDVSGILSQMGYGDPAGQSQYLREAGISGIRYLDGNSRGAADVNELRGTRSMWETALRKSPSDAYARSMFEEADAALRQAEAGLSSNYVVFNDELVKILRKYGISGLGLGGGAGLGACLLSNQQETPASTGL